ncbi:MAG: plasmid pRiA4b ORF-3 family protein, partial [Micrococcaceae bacterium]|nr:plasmid pRiA4b ORF-3 family protein [Micrococcaceae bacterium]
MRNLRTQHTVHVQLHGSEPAIFRRIEVDGSMTLARFHHVLQAALGWTDSHLHLYMDRNPFLINSVEGHARTVTWLMANSIEDGLEGEDETGTTLSKALARSGGTLWYEYDLGDSWMHLITEESSRARNPAEPEARVLEGALRVPVEDCGGLGGWYRLLEMRRAESLDPGQQEMLQWFTAGIGHFTPVDPEAFDAGEANMLIRLALEGTPSTGTAVTGWLSGLPVYLRPLFASALCKVGVDIFAPPAAPVMPEEAPAAMASILWWINACTGEGLPLTAAGYLSPAVLHTVISGIGWE